MSRHRKIGLAYQTTAPLPEGWLNNWHEALCRPCGTRFTDVSLPGTPVPGYRFYRPCGTHGRPGQAELDRRFSHNLF